MAKLLSLQTTALVLRQWIRKHKNYLKTYTRTYIILYFYLDLFKW